MKIDLNLFLTIMSLSKVTELNSGLVFQAENVELYIWKLEN